MQLRNFLGAAALGPMSRGEEEEWVKSTWKDRQEKLRFTFVVEKMKEKEMLGTASLFNCNWIDRSAILGIDILKPENWGKGYGTEAVRLLLDFAFRNLNLNRVELEVFDFNERAQKCYRKTGFKEAGRRRQAKVLDGKYRDVILMDILRNEWT